MLRLGLRRWRVSCLYDPLSDMELMELLFADFWFTERDRFAEALPTAATAGRGFTLKRRI